MKNNKFVDVFCDFMDIYHCLCLTENCSSYVVDHSFAD